MGDEIHLNIQRAHRECWWCSCVNSDSAATISSLGRQQSSSWHTKEDDGSILASAGAGRLDNEIDHGTVIKMCVPYSGTADTRRSPGRRHFLVTTYQHLYFRETVMSPWSEQRTSIIQKLMFIRIEASPRPDSRQSTERFKY